MPLSGKPRETVSLGVALLVLVAIAAFSFGDWKELSVSGARLVAMLGSLLLFCLLLLATITITRGIKRRQQLIEDLQTSHRETEQLRDLFQTALSSIGDAVIATDLSGGIAFVNPVAESLTGWSEAEAKGKPAEEVFAAIHGDSRQPLESLAPAVMRTGKVVRVADNVVLRARDGQHIAIEYSGAPIRDHGGALAGVVIVFRDVTERKRAEEQQRHTQKLESLGILAGGIAHDFNNLLTGIMGNASILQDAMPTHSENYRMARDIVSATERAAHLTSQMLAYSGKGRFVVEPLDLSAETEEILELIQASIPKNVELRLDMARELPVVEADRSQFQQLVMNLVINAAEAMDHRPGTVMLSTRAEDLDESFIAYNLANYDAKPGSFVVFEVQDTGHGMDEGTKSKMFDPFFTTKFAGRGLGLAAVSGIVRGHGGAITVYSHPATGTTFKVFLPAGEPGIPAGSRPIEFRSAGTSTILVVDDEEIVRRVAKASLEAHGYRVLLAENGKVGLETFTRMPDEIDLVLLDMTMPVMSGEEALREIKRVRPNASVVASSGYNQVEALRRFGEGLAGFIQKPYTAKQLADKLYSVLRGKR